MPKKNVKVTKVIDGDTFQIDGKIQGTNRVRVNKIDTPEKGRPGSNIAREIAQRMIEGLWPLRVTQGLKQATN